MKRTNAPPIPEGLRIELNGEQEWKDVMQVFEDAGWVWVSRSKPHEKQICSYNTVETSSNKKIANSGCVPITTELTATKFLQQYQGTIEYEVGDWVVILIDQRGDPEGTLTQVVHVEDFDSVYVKNITRLGTSITKWAAGVNTIRPATPEEIASVTKPTPVLIKKPEPYIWDGDVLPEEYWVENPWPGTDYTEFVDLFNGMKKGNNVGGASRWYHVKDSEYQECHNYSNPTTELPIVPYELWKSILEQPASEAEPVTERMFKKGDRVKVVRGSYESCIGTVDDIGQARSLYYVILDNGDASWFFSGKDGTGIDIVHYKDGPAVPKWSIVTTDGLRVYEGDKVWWLQPAGNKWFGDDSTEGDELVKETDEDHIEDGYLPFSTFEAAEGYISKQKQSAGRKWKVGDKYCIPGDNDGGWYIREYTKELYKVETSAGLKDYKYEAKEIDDYVNSGHWVRDHRPWTKNSKEKNDNQTNNQTKTKTKQNENIKESSIGISITEQCIVISSNYINCKTSNATYVPGDEERITKGQRRQGSTVRG